MKDKAPEPLKKPDFSKLEKMVTSVVKQRSEGERRRSDSDHYVFEAAMEAIYGKAIWKWWNKIEIPGE